MNKRYKAVDTFYSIGNVRYNLKHRRILMMILYAGSAFAALLIIIQYLAFHESDDSYASLSELRQYNSTYPLTAPRPGFDSTTFKIMAIADLDTKSKLNPDSHKFSSFILNGKHSNKCHFSVEKKF